MRIHGIGSLGIFISGVACDFNYILTSVLGNTSPAKLHFEWDDISRDKQVIAEKTPVMTRALAQQLSGSSESSLPVLKPASIAELLRDIAGFALSGPNVKCEFSMADNLWPVKMDAGKIGQVISNLMINADQAMPQGGVIGIYAENIILDAEHTLPLKREKYVKISVRDQGTGISEEHLQKIFDLYFTTKENGNGLGLAIVSAIVENHSGCITVDSQLGVGTTFHVYLPASPEIILIESRTEEKLYMGEGKVLIMDNEEMVREPIRVMLGEIGYEVATANDGSEAIGIYKAAQESQRPFDAVILDLTIPGGMGGKETLKKLKEINPEVKAIISSGYSNHPVMTNFREYGFSSVIPKPYAIWELSEVLNNVIKRNGRRT